MVCPFCYIGKRKFENALKQFPDAEGVDVVWKSFMLNPDEVTQPNVSALSHLAKNKGWTEEYTRGMFSHVSRMAEDTGLVFNPGGMKVANSFRAHRLIQLAKSVKKANLAEEMLFKAYFTEGKNIDDADMLISIGLALDFSEPEIIQAVNGNDWDEYVQNDLYEARQIGVRGVPYFVFNDRYAISGAQPEDVFLGVLEKAFAETRNRAF